MTTSPADNTIPLLEMRHISKSFPGVRALERRLASVEPGRGAGARRGERGGQEHADQGARRGPSCPTRARSSSTGGRVRLPAPTAAQRAGVSIIYQEFNLIPDLTVRENIFLGRERTRWGMIRSADEDREVRQLFERIGLRIASGEPLPRSQRGPAAEGRDRQGPFAERPDRRHGRTDGRPGHQGSGTTVRRDRGPESPGNRHHLYQPPAGRDLRGGRPGDGAPRRKVRRLRRRSARSPARR